MRGRGKIFKVLKSYRPHLNAAVEEVLTLTLASIQRFVFSFMGERKNRGLPDESKTTIRSLEVLVTSYEFFHLITLSFLLGLIASRIIQLRSHSFYHERGAGCAGVERGGKRHEGGKCSLLHWSPLPTLYLFSSWSEKRNSEMS